MTCTRIGRGRRIHVDALPARVRQHLYIAGRGQGIPAYITEAANGLAPH
jgi:hypothetical protein